MINAVGKFSNRLRLCATTEYKRLWLMDGVIKILSKKFNWYRTMRNNAEEAHPEVLIRACSLARGLRSGVGWKRVPPENRNRPPCRLDRSAICSVAQRHRTPQLPADRLPARTQLFEDFRRLTPGEHGTAQFFARLEKVKGAVIE